MADLASALSSACVFPSLVEIWSASEQAVRAENLDPPTAQLSAPWRLLLLSPTAIETSLQLITRHEAKFQVVESGRQLKADDTVPEFVRKHLKGDTVRLQYGLCGSGGTKFELATFGRALAHVTSWSLESEFQSGEGAASKSVQELIYGHNSALETVFSESGPLWGRIISSRSSVSYEIFSPHLAQFIGPPMEGPRSVSHLHSVRKEVPRAHMNRGDADGLQMAV